MKKYFFSILAAIFLFSSCNENMPVIACLTCVDEIPFDTIPPQDKRILLEEFSGVRCIGCPTGSIEIENMLSNYGDQLIAVSIHATGLANPYPENQYDFRTEEGTDLVNFLGLPDGLPSAVFNRKLFPGEADLQFVSIASWSGRVGTEIGDTADISMELENTYDSSERTLNVKVNGYVQEDINEEVRLTIMITESDIVDAQLTYESSPDRDLDYVHNHVFRKTLTPYDGEVLAEFMPAYEAFEKRYSFTLPQDWIPENCEVIAFTHLSENSKEVIQATSKHLTD